MVSVASTYDALIATMVITVMRRPSDPLSAEVCFLSVSIS